MYSDQFYAIVFELQVLVPKNMRKGQNAQETC